MNSNAQHSEYGVIIEEEHEIGRAPAENSGPSIRETEEYRAAWDVEVWKAIQVRQFQLEFKDTKRKEHEAFRKSLEIKEKEGLAKLERQSRELTTRERRIVEEERLLERRRHKSAEQEKELKAAQRQLDDHRKALDAEAELRVQRVKEEMAHRQELLHQKLAQSEDSARRFEDRLHASQTEYMKLFEEFSNFKTRQLANPDVVVAAQVERLRTDHSLELSSLQDRLDRRHQEHILTITHRCQQLESQVTQLSTSLASKKQSAKTKGLDVVKLSTSLEHAEKHIQQLKRDKELLEGKLLVAHRRLDALVGHHQTDEDEDTHRGLATSGAHTHGHAPHVHNPAAALRTSVEAFCAKERDSTPYHPPAAHSTAEKSFSEAQMAIKDEIMRLEREKYVLLNETGGAYTQGSPLIRNIDARVLELSRQCVLPLNNPRR